MAVKRAGALAGVSAIALAACSIAAGDGTAWPWLLPAPWPALAVAVGAVGGLGGLLRVGHRRAVRWVLLVSFMLVAHGVWRAGGHALGAVQLGLGLVVGAPLGRLTAVSLRHRRAVPRRPLVRRTMLAAAGTSGLLAGATADPIAIGLGLLCAALFLAVAVRSTRPRSTRTAP